MCIRDRVGSVTVDEATTLVAELDALVCLLYGLSRSRVADLFASFHRGWLYEDRLGQVLAHFTSWQWAVGDGSGA